MTLAFSARQQLSLPVAASADQLPTYLGDIDRVVAALLDPSQLEPLGSGGYRYNVSPVQVFQLQIQPIVQLEAITQEGRLELEARDCRLEGLGLVDDFQLSLTSWLNATPEGLEGEARLAVRVSQPPLLRLIPPKILESTGRSVLAGILLGIRNRVSQQLLADFQQWCRERSLAPARSEA
jgi:hypothetical protein